MKDDKFKNIIDMHQHKKAEITRLNPLGAWHYIKEVHSDKKIQQEHDLTLMYERLIQ